MICLKTEGKKKKKEKEKRKQKKEKRKKQGTIQTVPTYFRTPDSHHTPLNDTQSTGIRTHHMKPPGASIGSAVSKPIP
ncbi:hypothetical protein L873DRAFT_1814065 [Choiromyces venosus 120613-1]|uniref:Uncharacterized protein n=1 Tax=Choiromyces venosus 120613-1 TaxID=1336337 RepID=A0A3N4JB63_9PEZI|nr:hypothetical protein L873DRAFT_1814065 [Choiromyces venosus 120613-1]